MSFLHPEFLYLMLPALLILFALLLTQQEHANQFFSLRILERLRVDSDQFSLKVRHLFFALMLFFIIIALSTPVVKQGSAYVQNQKNAIYLAVNKNELKAITKELIPLIEDLENPYVGLLLFDTKSYLLSPPTHNVALLVEMLEGVSESHKSETDLIALIEATDKLYENDVQKQLILVGVGGTQEAQKVLQKALEKDVALSLYTEDQTKVSPAFLNVLLQSGGAVLNANALEQKLSSVNVNPTKDEQPIYFYLFIVPIALAMLMFIIATSSFHRGESHYVPLLFLLLFGLPDPVNAEMFGNHTLHQAALAYEEENFDVCAKLYSSYGLKHQSQEAIYNAANCYYKEQRYSEAIAFYKAIHFDDKQKNYKLYFNLANALLASQERENLLEAINVYKKLEFYKHDAQHLVMRNIIKSKLTQNYKTGVRIEHQPAIKGKTIKIEKEHRKKASAFYIQATLIK